MDCKCLVRVKEREEVCIYFYPMICEPQEKSLQYLILLLTEKVLHALTIQKKKGEILALSSAEEKSHFFKV